MRDWNLQDLLLWRGYDGAVAEIERMIDERWDNLSDDALEDIMYIEELLLAKSMAIALKKEYESSGRNFPGLGQFFNNPCPMTASRGLDQEET